MYFHGGDPCSVYDFFFRWDELYWILGDDDVVGCGDAGRQGEEGAYDGGDSEFDYEP